MTGPGGVLVSADDGGVDGDDPVEVAFGVGLGEQCGEEGGKGVVPWGSTEWADAYFWLLDAEQPGGDFLYRVLADADFQPSGIAQYDLGTTFEPGSGDPLNGQPP